MRQQAEAVCTLLHGVGVEIIEQRDLHQKLAILDRAVAWEGSLNILSQRSTTEHMRRLGDWQTPATRTCKELVAVHSLGIDAQAASRNQHSVHVDCLCPNCDAPMLLKREQSNVLAICTDSPQCLGQLPVRRQDRIATDVPCPTCGQSLLVRFGKRGPFLGCPQYPACKGTRDI
jgi:hypothetical protein